MIEGYSGDAINYVCDQYRDNGQTCHQVIDNNIKKNSSEEIPKTFFSLMVKIYLS